MPAWTPPPDVHFDHRAAADAMAEAAVTLLSTTLLIEAEQESLAEAQTNWLGSAREATGHQMDIHLRAMHGASEELRRVLHDLGAAIDDSTTEQLRRDGLQQQWLIEQQAEVIQQQADLLESAPR